MVAMFICSPAKVIDMMNNKVFVRSTSFYLAIVLFFVLIYSIHILSWKTMTESDTKPITTQKEEAPRTPHTEAQTVTTKKATVTPKVPQNSVDCFRQNAPTLPDISSVNPKRGKSVFFHETSCISYNNGKISITARQACAVESAARLNPNLDVYLLYTSPGEIKMEGDESDLYLQALMKYDNVKIMHLDFAKYTKGTPVEELYTSKKLDNSLNSIEHASDILRYVSLWKYGGIYLDLDTITLKTLEKLKPNFASPESTSFVAAGILGFEPDGVGHQWADMCLNDLRVGFTGKDWANSSVGVITRLLRSICTTRVIPDMTEETCKGFKLYPTKDFYPVFWDKYMWMFQEEHFLDTLKLAENATATHNWNKLTRGIKINIKNVYTPYLYYAKKFCPNVLSECKEIF